MCVLRRRPPALFESTVCKAVVSVEVQLCCRENAMNLLLTKWSAASRRSIELVDPGRAEFPHLHRSYLRRADEQNTIVRCTPRNA
eukprot:4964582-Prymnesium_polylepis.2